MISGSDIENCISIGNGNDNDNLYLLTVINIVIVKKLLATRNLATSSEARVSYFLTYPCQCHCHCYCNCHYHNTCYKYSCHTIASLKTMEDSI